MKILVTGATGFVGSHLCEHLLSQGHQVYALGRSHLKLQSLSTQVIPVMGTLHPSIKNNWIENLPQDLDSVIHAAAIAHSFSNRNFYDTNFRSTAQFISDLKERYTHLTFCLISSLAASGPTGKDGPRTEEMIPSPISHYGHSKHLAELVLQSDAPNSWRKLIIRPPIVIGPRDTAFLDFFKMIKQRLIIYPGLKGNRKRYSFICVYDLIDAISKSVSLKTRKQNIEIYHVGFPQDIIYKDLLDTIADLMGTKDLIRLPIPPLLLIPIAYLIKLLHHFYSQIDFRLTTDKISEISAAEWTLASERTDEILDLSYRWDLKKTLEITFQDYKQRGWI